MKNFAALLLCVAVTGCSGFYELLDKMNQPPTWPADKIPVYPEQGWFEVPRREVDHYKCVKGILYCEGFGIEFSCRCEVGQIAL